LVIRWIYDTGKKIGSQSYRYQQPPLTETISTLTEATRKTVAMSVFGLATRMNLPHKNS